MFNQFGDVERCALRPGNVHSAHEWHDVLEPVVARYRDKAVRRSTSPKLIILDMDSSGSPTYGN